jgi:hypothetical protein
MHELLYFLNQDRQVFSPFLLVKILKKFSIDPRAVAAAADLCKTEGVRTRNLTTAVTTRAERFFCSRSLNRRKIEELKN